VPATGHKYVWTTLANATCVADGARRGNCTVCFATATQTINALGHEYGEWKVTTEPTCTDKGEETSVCANCNDKQTRSVDALGHDYGEAVVVQEATTTISGITNSTCANCGDVIEGEIPCLVVEEPADTSEETVDSEESEAPENTVTIVEEEVGAESTNGFPWYIILVVVAAGIVIFFLKRKKKA
jgi:hypothetical protein